MPHPKPSIFFVSSEFHFTDRFPRWNADSGYAGPDGNHRSKAEFARELEELGFDAVFAADFAGLNRNQIRHNGPRSFEPLTLAAFLAAHTDRIGLVITLSTQFSEPYTVARELNSLDRLSAGRAGWNVVTSFNGESNYGYSALPTPADRYRRAREFLDVTMALWTSWDPMRSCRTGTPKCTSTPTGSVTASGRVRTSVFGRRSTYHRHRRGSR